MTLDDRIDALVDHARGNVVLDHVFEAASIFGDDGRGWIAASALRSRRTDAPMATFARQMAWLTIESVLVNGPAKGLVRRTRPTSTRAVRRHVRRPSNSSFPSGHAASAATMAMLLSEDGLAPLWWSIALTVAASRVYVGVHHPSDVVGGLAVGAGIGWAARHVELPMPASLR